MREAIGCGLILAGATALADALFWLHQRQLLAATLWVVVGLSITRLGASLLQEAVGE